jgi:hypothetical protein
MMEQSAIKSDIMPTPAACASSEFLGITASCIIFAMTSNRDAGPAISFIASCLFMFIPFVAFKFLLFKMFKVLLHPPTGSVVVHHFLSLHYKKGMNAE